MANYRQIKGITISNVDSDPVVYAASWSAGGNLNTSRRALAGGGTQTAGLAFGGDTPGATAVTENWDGTSWTEVSDLSTARSSLAGAGTGSASALAFGGSVSPKAQTEEWSAPAVFSKMNLGQVFYNSTSNTFKVTEQPASGGSFSSGGSLNTSRGYFAGFGSQTAGAVSGGSPYSSPPKAQLHEQYNGSSWTEANDLNSGHAAGSSATKAPQSAGLTFCGGPPPSGVKNEAWNGSSWTEVNDLSTNRNNGRPGS